MGVKQPEREFEYGGKAVTKKGVWDKAAIEEVRGISCHRRKV